MLKRSAAAVLWFFAGWCFYELAWSLTGIPRSFGPVLGTVLAVFVTADPLALFWPRSSRAMHPTTIGDWNGAEAMQSGALDRLPLRSVDTLG
jgi:hypothetical protein